MSSREFRSRAEPDLLGARLPEICVCGRVRSPRAPAEPHCRAERDNPRPGEDTGVGSRVGAALVGVGDPQKQPELLLQLMQEFSQQTISRTHEIKKQVDGLIRETKATDCRLHNVFNDFLMLSNTQFIENSMMMWQS
ncbi:Wash Complex Subunit 2C [Manis pentadactyla]|nr:Wash Complex Subunit 2C [Manis pentadactyla]